MKVEDFAKTLLFGEKIEEKLFYPEEKVVISSGHTQFDIPTVPGRDKRLKFSELQVKFPKKGTLGLPENKGRALHFFANHELLAIEIMAAVLLKLPATDEDTKNIKKQIVFTIKDGDAIAGRSRSLNHERYNFR